MKITALGDSALLIDVEPATGESAEQTLRRVLSIKKSIERAAIPGLTECSSSYRTVAAFFQPLAATRHGIEPRAASSWFEDRIRKAIASSKAIPAFPFPKSGNSVLCRTRIFPRSRSCRCPHRAWRRGSRSAILRHSFSSRFGRIYPGLSLPIRIAGETGLPSPIFTAFTCSGGFGRDRGNQAGIYPMVSPGGWNVIGRTRLKLFAPDHDPPTLLRPGDRIRFRRINREEFETSGAGRCHCDFMEITVSKAGFLTTVQDRGRIGQVQYGVSPGGAVDVHAARVVNTLVGNGESLGILEITSGTVRLRLNDARVLAWAGGEYRVMCGELVVPPRTFRSARGWRRYHFHRAQSRRPRAGLPFQGE